MRPSSGLRDRRVRLGKPISSLKNRVCRERGPRERGQALSFISKINRNFEIFTGPDFLATITQHIPDKGAQMVQYYGWYSNKMRGQRQIAQNGIPAEPLRPASIPPPPATLPSKKWRDVILKVWHTDPLLCPHCQRKMEVIAVIH